MPSAERILEAQRCLSNIYLQCHKSQDLALNNQTLPGVLHQVTKYKEHQVPPPIISFDMKIQEISLVHLIFLLKLSFDI